MLRFAVVVSEYNEEINRGLLEGARSYLRQSQVELREDDIFYAPGAFEIPLIAQKLAQTGHFEGIICLGCVIKGETAHFEYISLATTMGIMQSNLQTGVPITFGILTTYDEAQALRRSKPSDTENKGREAAAACVKSVKTLSVIKGQNLGNLV